MDDIVSAFILNTTCFAPQYFRVKHTIFVRSVGHLVPNHFSHVLGSRVKGSSHVLGEIEQRCAIAGSLSEFYITPSLPTAGDADVIARFPNAVAAEAHHRLYTFPTEESDCRFCIILDMVETEFAGYFLLKHRCVLVRESVEGCNPVYRFMPCDGEMFESPSSHHLSPMDSSLAKVLLSFYFERGKFDDNTVQVMSKARELFSGEYEGPAQCTSLLSSPVHQFLGSTIAYDTVISIRCLYWPSASAGWPTRRREHGWPDPATIEKVVNDGCDLVRKVHPLCKNDPFIMRYQHRLSFSRAETTLLLSWSPEQQIIYHMLRFVCKKEKLFNKWNDEVETLSNYHIKTVMLWACEVKSHEWWIGSNMVNTCMKLFRTMYVWVMSGEYHHYFINDCNLVDFIQSYDDESKHEMLTVCKRLESLSESTLCEWFITNYLFDSRSRVPFTFETFSKMDVSVLQKWVETVTPPDEFRLFSLLDLMLDLYGIVNDIPSTLWLKFTEKIFLIIRCELAAECPWLLDWFRGIVFARAVDKLRHGSRSEAGEWIDIVAVTFHPENRPELVFSMARSNRLFAREAAYHQQGANDSANQADNLIRMELYKFYKKRSETEGDFEFDVSSPAANALSALSTELVNTNALHKIVVAVCHAFCLSASDPIIPALRLTFTYQLGLYEKCLQLSLDEFRFRIGADSGTEHLGAKAFVLIDHIAWRYCDELSSIFGMMCLVQRRPMSWFNVVSRKALCFTLSVLCRIHLGHSGKSVADTLQYIGHTTMAHPFNQCVDHTLLTFVYRRAIIYMKANRTD